VAVRATHEPSRVSLQPIGEELDWSWEDGYVRVRVTILDGHAMVVVED
jgi:hypothetical protein